MKKRRKTENRDNLTNGPGKMTQAFGINKSQNKQALTGGGMYVAEGKKEKFKIGSSPRIGIKQGLDLKWRFYIKGNKYVSV